MAFGKHVRTQAGRFRLERSGALTKNPRPDYPGFNKTPRQLEPETRRRFPEWDARGFEKAEVVNAPFGQAIFLIRCRPYVRSEDDDAEKTAERFAW